MEGLDSFKTFVETFALLMAGIFFGWKWLSGSLIANMNIEPVVERKTKDSTAKHDYLTITTKLIKGDRGSTEIIKLNIKIVENGADAPFIEKDLLSPRLPGQDRNVRLSPGESTQFSFIFEVPHEKAYNIEIYIAGKSIIIPEWAKREQDSQWKASVCSIPL